METFSLLPLNFHSTNDEAYDALARHLSALKKGVRNLEAEAKEMEERRCLNVVAETPSRRIRLAACSSRGKPACDGQTVAPVFPYQGSFKSLEDGEWESFTYEGEMRGRKLLFKARTSKGALVCVKFVRRYGKEVHAWCAGKGFAPKLMGFEELAGGWYMVVIECLDERWAELGMDKVAKGVKETFLAAIGELHQAGMVHGDVRKENVMVKDGGKEFKLLDFDWAGVLGEVRYPRHVNKAVELRRPEDVSDGELIAAGHDMAMVEQMFD
jgi:hypothetical protein